MPKRRKSITRKSIAGLVDPFRGAGRAGRRRRDPAIVDQANLRFPDYQQLFAHADAYVARTLFATVVIGRDAAIPPGFPRDALDAVAPHSRFYHKRAFTTADGDVMATCYDAGLMVGLAYGLRLRGHQ